MKPSLSVMLKSLSPGMIARSIQTFDRLTLLIISICWATTIIVMLFAIYTINLSAAAQKAAEAALATEADLPQIKRSGVGGKELQVMIERLQQRYPDVTFLWQDNVLLVGGKDGGRYHQWLMALGQIDTLYPQYHWKIRELCVGTGCKSITNLMSVSLSGEKIAFEMPQKDEKK